MLTCVRISIEMYCLLTSHPDRGSCSAHRPFLLRSVKQKWFELTKPRISTFQINKTRYKNNYIKAGVPRAFVVFILPDPPTPPPFIILLAI